MNHLQQLFYFYLFGFSIIYLFVWKFSPSRSKTPFSLPESSSKNQVLFNSSFLSLPNLLHSSISTLPPSESLASNSSSSFLSSLQSNNQSLQKWNDSNVKPKLLSLRENEFRLVTAFSSNHFSEALTNCISVKNLKETQNWKPGYMIAYILKDDLSEENIKLYRNECPFVTLRNFNATKYPTFVSSNLFEYRWKSLIVSEVLKEVEKVFWIDSSIIFNNYAAETITEVVQKMDTKFLKCGIRFFGDAGHSIMYATNPKMLQYFNVSEDTAKNNTMIAGGLFIISRKGSQILQKWNKCAMKKECMAPEGSLLNCNCQECKTQNIYGNCHRYDQSVLSILTLQCSSNISDFHETTSLIGVLRM